MTRICKSFLTRISLRSAGTSSANKFEPRDGKVNINVKMFEDRTREQGRFMTYKPPIYVGPHIHPLHLGPDFSFLDNRSCPFTSKEQLEHKKDQIRLAKKIVTLLSQMNEIEKESEKFSTKRLAESTKKQNERPRAKGNKLIDQT